MTPVLSRYYLERLPLGSSTARLVYLNFVLNILEQISLVGLSFVPSSELFEVHEAFFLTFLATSMLSILLTTHHFNSRCGFQARSQEERKSVEYKRLLTRVTLVSAGL